MIVEIVFADNRTEHIEVRDGDDPSQLARQFLATYKLPASYEKVLREQIVASIAEDERQRQLQKPAQDDDDEGATVDIDRMRARMMRECARPRARPRAIERLTTRATTTTQTRANDGAGQGANEAKDATRVDGTRVTCEWGANGSFLGRGGRR